MRKGKPSGSPKKSQMSELVQQFPFAVIPSKSGVSKVHSSIETEKVKPTLKKPK